MKLPAARLLVLVGVLIVPRIALAQETKPGLELHVAPGGNDAGAGTQDAPFASLERARDEIRALKKAKGLPAGGVTVTLHGGLHELRKTFELAAEDSGTETSPITYRARPGEEVRLSGGRRVLGWKRVADSAVLEQLDPAAQDHVLCADLRAMGLKQFGKLSGERGSGPGLELFLNDRPMTLSRYPNEGFIKIAGIAGPTEVNVRGTKGCAEPIFTYDSDRLARWQAEKDGWVHGYWFWDWADQRQPIESIDAAAKRMTLGKPYHSYGYRKGQWFYGFNLLCEIDEPGEWYLDREAGILYFWPPATEPGQSPESILKQLNTPPTASHQAQPSRPASQASSLKPQASSQAVVSMLESLIALDGAQYVTLQGLTLEASRGTAVNVTDAAETHLIGCTLRNLGRAAVSIHGVRSSVVGCDIYGTGNGGIALNGGDRQKLEPANLVAENNHVHHWSRWNRMYQGGISLAGVGNRAAHNLLHHSPHTAIFFSGNDHAIEWNEIHDVCLESNDAGAIYAGRNWTMRGTVIRYNHLHHIRGFERRGCMGVYLDDMYCGTTIHGNLFHDVARAAFIGGGHDNTIENNIFVDCQPAVHVDARALGWAHSHSDGWIQEAAEKGTLSGIHFDRPPYSTRYPTLPGILKHDPAAPTGALIARNVCWGGRWDEIRKEALPFIVLKDNLLDADPLFVDAAHGNYQLRDDSPALKLGFQRIPLDKIGLVNDGTRASWPAEKHDR